MRERLPSLRTLTELWKKSKFRCSIDRDGCPQCGGQRFSFREILPTDLIETWELSEDLVGLVNRREGTFCEGCGQSLRVRMLTWTLRKLFPSLEGLSVLHVNNINGFAASLTTASSVVHSTYLPEEKLGAEVGGQSNQDVERLTFEDQRFDVVIHSETVEHVFDPDLALRELHRVLKPGGVQIYTVPLLWKRRTRQRMKRSAAGTISHLLPPSYHGLDMEYPVVWEFGGDFFHQRSKFLRAIFFDNFLANPTVFSIVERRPTSVV